MTQADEMVDGGQGALVVVGHHAGHGWNADPLDLDHRYTRVRGELEIMQIAHRSEENRIDLPPEERFHRIALDLRIFLGVRRQHPATKAGGLLIDAERHIGEKGIGRNGTQHMPNDERPLPAQPLSHRVDAIAGLFDRGLDRDPGLLRNIALLMNDARHRGGRNPRQPGNIFEGSARFGRHRTRPRAIRRYVIDDTYHTPANFPCQLGNPT